VTSRLREVVLPLCSHETPPGVLRPALGFPVRERHEPVGVGPEEGHENGLRAGTQNHRMAGVGRDLCGSSSPTLLPKQGHLQ